MRSEPGHRPSSSGRALVLGGEARAGEALRPLPAARTRARVGGQLEPLEQRPCHAALVAVLEQHADPLAVHHLRHRAVIGTDHRRAARKRLHQHQPERLPVGGERGHPRARVSGRQLARVLHRVDQVDALAVQPGRATAAGSRGRIATSRASGARAAPAGRRR